MGEDKNMYRIKAKDLLIIISFVISVLAICCMGLDHYWTGDEVITYSMANSDYDAF